ncbi:MAG: hypothetical protein BGO68_05370 [Candidatus Amoebophilus sp. 36-38]|nr:MAG: hypothetical protein BGO68_05370 [Candidatus Amoebophilus sp. 36-38]
MYTSFEKLSDQANIWIYQADQQLSPTQSKAILEQAKVFLESWSSHGRPLLASVQIKHDYFLILGIEKADFELSCCTTDSAIQFLHQVKTSTGVDFLNRGKIIIKEPNKYSILSIREAKERLQAETITPDMLTFDNTITQKKELETRWLIPVKKAWFSK